MRRWWFALIVAVLTFGCLPTGPVITGPPTVFYKFLSHRLDVTVTDARTGDPIGSARIWIEDGPNAGVGASTDATGRATFPILIASSFSLCVSANDFERQCSSVTLAGDQTLVVRMEPTGPPPAVCGRLRTDGRLLVCQNGQPFVWRGVTAFRLLDYVADGEDDKAIAFLDWARDQGFNTVRVLAMLCCWFDLTPADGQRALPRLMELAFERGIYLHLVALAGTGEREIDIEAQVAAIGKVAAENDIIALAEIANEVYHGTQDERLHDGTLIEAMGAALPENVLWAGGATAVDEPHCYDPPACSDIRVDRPWGEVITRHLDRGRERFQNWRRLRELESVSAMTGRHVLSGEPLGFGEVEEPGRRTVGDTQAYAYGVLCRIFALSCTFHMDDGLHALVPRPHQQAAAEAFNAGSRVVADDVVLDFQNAHVEGRASWPFSPVQRFDDTSAIRVYSGITDTEGIVIALGSNRPTFEWGHGWQPVEVLYEASDMIVWRIAR